MNGKSKIQHQIMTIKISGADVVWDNLGCSIESSSLKKYITTKASNIEKFITSTNLLNHFSVMAFFARDGAMIKVLVWSQCDDFPEFESKLALVTRKLHSEYLAYQNFPEEKSDPASCDHPQETPPQKSEHNRIAEIALAKFSSGLPGEKIEIDFHGSGKEFVQSTKSRPPPPKELNHNAEEKQSGEVKFFDEGSQKVTLFNLVGLPGHVTLDVDFKEDRLALLNAQAEYRQVVLIFTPARTQPGEQARAGKLISIESVGEAREKLL